MFWGFLQKKIKDDTCGKEAVAGMFACLLRTDDQTHTLLRNGRLLPAPLEKEFEAAAGCQLSVNIKAFTLT